VLFRRVEIMIVIALLFGFVLGLCLGIGDIRSKTMAEERTFLTDGSTYHKSPRKKFVVSIQKDQQKELFNQFKIFADKNRFAVRIAPNTPSGEDFSIEMWREDIMMFGANPFEPGELGIGFYNTDDANPYPMPEQTLNTLINDFTEVINEIPNATIFEEK